MTGSFNVNMRFQLLLLSLFLSLSLFSNEVSKVNLSINFQPTSLFMGEQKDVLDEALTPTPDSYSSAALSANLQYFPLPNFGLEINYLFLGVTEARNKEVQEPLEVYDHKSLDFGAIIRYNSEIYNDYYYSFFLSGGLTYSFLDYKKEFKDLFPYIDDFYDIDSELGWYAKLGGNYNFNKYLFVGASLKFYYLNNIVNETGYKFDGYYWCLPLYVGISY